MNYFKSFFTCTEPKLSKQELQNDKHLYDLFQTFLDSLEDSEDSTPDSNQLKEVLVLQYLILRTKLHYIIL